MQRFVTDTRPSSARRPTAYAEFYREEFVKHQRWLQRQREYYSESAIESADAALRRVLDQLDRLCSQRNGDLVVSQLLRKFDSVTGLSAWSDPKKAH
jgi:hypothetical protein